jgi:CBS domain containing-hemolysin-like protein
MALLTILLLVLLNGVFAMSEMAVVASRRARLRERVRRGDRNAAIAFELHNAPNTFLSTIQIGITLVGVLLGAVGERALATDIAALRIWRAQGDGNPDRYPRGHRRRPTRVLVSRRPQQPEPANSEPS